MHCAVPFFCARSGTEGEAAWRSGEWVVRAAGNALRSLRACVGAAWACVGVAWGSGSAREGRVAVRGERRSSAGNVSRSLRACVGAAWGSGSVREGRVAVRGRAKGFGGEWVVRAAGLTHIRRSSTRARVLLYIRPPCPRREIAAMGPKDAPASTHRPRRLPYPPRLRLHFRTRVHTSPASPSVPPTKNSPFRRMTSAPAPSAFTLPLHRLPRPPRSNRPPAAAVIHNGLSTEKLSTSLPAALCKTFSPSRLRTRIYNISFARRPLPGSVRAVVPRVPRRRAQGGGGRRQRRTPPRAVPSHAACVPNHCAQRRSAQGKPRPCPCILPAAACLRPRPCPLMGELPCVKAEVHKAIPAPARAFSPRQLVYARAPAR